MIITLDAWIRVSFDVRLWVESVTVIIGNTFMTQMIISLNSFSIMLRLVQVLCHLTIPMPMHSFSPIMKSVMLTFVFYIKYHR